MTLPSYCPQSILVVCMSTEPNEDQEAYRPTNDTPKLLPFAPLLVVEIE